MINCSELYSALQQKVVDGQENPIATIANMRFFEVQKHLTLSDHGFIAYVFMINKPFLDKLPADQRDVLVNTAREASKYQRELIQKAEAAHLETFKKAGLESLRSLPSAWRVRKASRPSTMVHRQFRHRDSDLIRNTFSEVSGELVERATGSSRTTGTARSYCSKQRSSAARWLLPAVLFVNVVRRYVSRPDLVVRGADPLLMVWIVFAAHRAIPRAATSQDLLPWRCRRWAATTATSWRSPLLVFPAGFIQRPATLPFAASAGHSFHAGAMWLAYSLQPQALMFLRTCSCLRLARGPSHRRSRWIRMTDGPLPVRGKRQTIALIFAAGAGLS